MISALLYNQDMFIKILFRNVGCNVTAIFIIKNIHLDEVVL